MTKLPNQDFELFDSPFISNSNQRGLEKSRLIDWLTRFPITNKTKEPGINDISIQDYVHFLQTLLYALVQFSVPQIPMNKDLNKIDWLDFQYTIKLKKQE